MSKPFAIVLVSLLSILAVGIIIGFVVLLKNDFNFNFHMGTSYSENLLESKTIENIKDLDIISQVADTFIEETDEDKITIELYSEKAEEHTINEEESTIKAVLKHNNKTHFSFFSKRDKIVVKLPKNYDKTIKADTDTGDLNIESFELANANLKTVTGDIEITKLNNVTATINTGDFKADTIKDATIKISTGDIKINTIDNIETKGTTGDVKVENINNKLTIVNTTGDIKITNATINENSSIENKTGDVKISKLTGAYIDAHTKTGDTKVNNNDRKLDTEIKISTTTGDIKVN